MILSEIVLQDFRNYRNLALEFDVTQRTILRDIDVIARYIPVYCKRGRFDGGVYVDPNFRMDRAYMMPEELSVLKKVRSTMENDTKPSFSVEDISILDRIIKNYSIPSEK